MFLCCNISNMQWADLGVTFGWTEKYMLMGAEVFVDGECSGQEGLLGSWVSKGRVLGHNNRKSGIITLAC